MTHSFNSAEAVDAPGPRAELVDPARTVAFMLAGNAHVTFQSRRTGTRFTYRVQAAERREGTTGPSHFVSVLTGPDDYAYLGCIYSRRAYVHGRKSRIAQDAPSAVAFMWVWKRLFAGSMHPELGVWHEGRCGKCGRRLTTPESISIGLGPTCLEKQG
jgi:Family of unknown function (DUF6011)